MELLEKIQLLRRLPFMSDWIDNELKTVSYHFKALNFGKN